MFKILINYVTIDELAVADKVNPWLQFYNKIRP